TGSDETGVRDLIFSRLDTSADKIAKDDFWKKVDGLCLPKSSVVVCETELDFGNKGKDVVIRGESELEIWLPKRNTIVSRVFPDGHDLSVERKLIPYVKYPGHLSAGDKYWGGGTTHPEKVWGL
ncbi:MAG: hypothetical protein JW727_05115, partial [Candidatus Aenigmarchaeota archaeon]|nr:hypothetical protein [Candidatus Aenigmarchaeota archaeon]